MEKLFRNIAPKFKTIDSIDVLPDEKHTLSNHIPVHIINGGSQDIVKIEFIFEAGTWYHDSPLVANMANSMLNEGTNKYNAAQIAEKFDFYGAYIGFSCGGHDSSVCLYSLNKHLKETLELTENLIKDSVFPRKEFETILQNKKQAFLVDRQKTNVLAKEKFNRLIYGESHPYVNAYSDDEFEKVKLEEVQEFYKSYYTAENCKIIVAGKVNQPVIDKLKELFGNTPWPNQSPQAHANHRIVRSELRKSFVCKDDAIQACIRIGRPIFTKVHNDYTTLNLFHVILGGYFGSRLMQNIREDKGYTYGINSIIVSHQAAGHFAITTEVGSEVCRNAVSEIFREIKKLREEPVPEDELKLVKNYITGEVIRNLDNPFSISESLKSNLPFGLNNSYYQRFIKELKEITPDMIQDLANKYFREEDLYVVVCGPKSCENIFS